MSETERDRQFQELQRIFTELDEDLGRIKFSAPVTHVYNPLRYASVPLSRYSRRYLCGKPGRTFLLGMNPGPWGMAQTGVPFGEVEAARNWLKIDGPVSKPVHEHPKRPVTGFDCRRSEVSGRRLWGLFAERFADATSFAQEFLVFNYCPLIFLEESGRNRTPDKLPKSEREALFEICDNSLCAILELFEIETAFGIGKFAQKRLYAVQERVESLTYVDSILHPSPANPAANRGWAESVAPVLWPEFSAR